MKTYLSVTINRIVTWRDLCSVYESYRRSDPSAELCLGLEPKDRIGAPHIQGYIGTDHPRELVRSTLKGVLAYCEANTPSVFLLDRQVSDRERLITYCKKFGTYISYIDKTFHVASRMPETVLQAPPLTA